MGERIYLLFLLYSNFYGALLIFISFEFNRMNSQWKSNQDHSTRTLVVSRIEHGEQPSIFSCK